MSSQSLLTRIIKEKIEATGPIPFTDLMEMALYFPALGYYTREDAMIGRAGDFYTSPHLHPLFGALMGKQMEEMWHLLGSPRPFHVIEMGAGLGYLAKDMLQYLRTREIFNALRYSIIEINPALKLHQESLLQEFQGMISWSDNLQDLPLVTGCFLSNELLDAFPVRLIEMDDELREIFVSVKNDEFVESKTQCSPEVLSYFEEFSIDAASFMARGYRTEVNLEIKEWIKQISSKLQRGFILTVDYGYTSEDYYSKERNRGTLLCYNRHELNENPYINIGEQDITAHVNFSSLKKWGEELDLRTLGFAPQGTYLISVGLDEVIADMPGLISDEFDPLKIKGLLLPEGMGESHKVMVQYKGDGDFRLKGFELRNRMKYL